MKQDSKQFEPDHIVLSKKDILEFCDRVLAKWKEEPKTNSRNIVAMSTVKTSVFWTDEESLKAIWGEILKWTFELMYKNAISQVKEDNSKQLLVIEKKSNKERIELIEADIWY